MRTAKVHPTRYLFSLFRYFHSDGRHSSRASLLKRPILAFFDSRHASFRSGRERVSADNPDSVGNVFCDSNFFLSKGQSLTTSLTATEIKIFALLLVSPDPNDSDVDNDHGLISR